jgi:hypothetical protein
MSHSVDALFVTAKSRLLNIYVVLSRVIHKSLHPGMDFVKLGIQSEDVDMSQFLGHRSWFHESSATVLLFA